MERFFVALSIMALELQQRGRPSGLVWVNVIIKSDSGVRIEDGWFHQEGLGPFGHFTLT